MYEGLSALLIYTSVDAVRTMERTRRERVTGIEQLIPQGKMVYNSRGAELVRKTPIYRVSGQGIGYNSARNR